MAINIPAAIVIALAAAGTTVAVESAIQSGSKKDGAAPALPALPSISSATDTSSQAQTQQRQAALAAGGQTNVTGGTGIVLGSDVNSVTLVGSS